MVNCNALGDEIATLAARVNAGMHRLLTCIRTFDEAGGWHSQGAQSCAHWLTWRIGIDRGAAREKVRVARALRGLPKIDAAFAAGRLSYSKVRAVTRIATPANEEQVLDVALVATGAQMERICRGYRRATRAETEAAVDRCVRARVLGNGLVKLEVIVSSDEADLLVKAIEHAREQLSPPPPAKDAPPADGMSKVTAPRPSGADALVHLASAHLAGGDVEAAAGGKAAAAGDYQVVIHVDRGLTSGEGTLAARLEDGTPVSAETLRRVCCDGGVVAAAVDERGAVLDVGRRTRSIPTAIRRALSIRDQGCRFPGCGNQRHLHGHHVTHWLHGGATSLENLALLCSFHHRQVHEGGFAFQLNGDGEVEVHTVAGELLPAQPILAADPGAVEWWGGWEHWTGGPDSDDDIDEWTATPTWNGERADYTDIVGGLIVPSPPPSLA